MTRPRTRFWKRSSAGAVPPPDRARTRPRGTGAPRPGRGYRTRPWTTAALAASRRGRGRTGPARRRARRSCHLAGAGPARRHEALRAPPLLSTVHSPVPDHPKIPGWEQLAATTGMVTTLSLLLHGHGWASTRRTGQAVQAPRPASTSVSPKGSNCWAGCTSALAHATTGPSERVVLAWTAPSHTRSMAD